MDTSVPSRFKLQDIVRAITKQRQGDQGHHDLAGVYIRRVALGPAVRISSDDCAVGGSNGNIDADCQAIQAECPENVWEKHDLESVLCFVSIHRDEDILQHPYDKGPISLRPVWFTLEQCHIRAKSPGLVL